MRNSIDMINGSFGKNIFRFALPLVLMSMLQILFAACDDMVILGLFVSTDALAAVGATTYIVNLFINGFAGLAVGVNVTVAQQSGAGDREGVSKAVHTAVASSLLLGFALIILGQLFSGWALSAIGTPENILDDAVLYIRIYFLSAPASLLFNNASAVMRARGDSRHPFIFMTLSGIADIFLCSFFVLAFNLGVAGVAIGTVSSQYIAAFLSVLYLRRQSDECRLSIRKLRLHMRIFLKILKIGIPTGLNNMAFSLSNMMLQGAINSFGSAAVAGCSVSTTMEHFIYAATNSFMQAVISFTGQNAGAGRNDNIRKSVRWCLLYSALAGTLLGAFVWLAGYPLLPLFIDEESIAYAMQRNLIVMLPYGLCGIMEVYAGAQRGLGRGTGPTVITLLGVCAFRILWINTAFQAAPTITMLFLSYPVSWTITAVAHYICYRRSLAHFRRITG